MLGTLIRLITVPSLRQGEIMTPFGVYLDQAAFSTALGTTASEKAYTMRLCRCASNSNRRRADYIKVGALASLDRFPDR